MAQISYIIPFTYKWEGGLSNDPRDKASATPSPYEYKGQKGWHTNKGVTYAVFRDNADRLGYKDTANNFLTMPEDIWLKIAKYRFWDKVNADDIKSQAVANIIFSWQWGSGYAWRPRIQRYLNSKGFSWENTNDTKRLASNLNALVDKQGEKKTFDELVEQKKEFFESLNQPVYLKGWLNRLDDLKEYSYTLLGKGVDIVKKNPIPVAIVTALLIVSGYVLYTQLKKK